MPEATLEEKILIDEEFFSTLIATIEATKESLDLETYIFEDDVVGRKVAAVLAAAAQRGVKVRVLVDGVGSIYWGGELTQIMEENGVETRIYHPLPWLIKQYRLSSGKKSSFLSKLEHFIFKMNRRTHRKLAIFDNNTVIIGSANVKECFVTGSGERIGLRDASVKITNVDTQLLQYAFDKAWGQFSIYPKLNRLFYKDKNPQFRLNFTWRLRFRLYRGLLYRIKTAKQRIWIANAYFVANNFLLKRLIKAAKRGVDVQIILPGQYEMSYFSLLTRSFYTMLLEAGVKIYEYKKCILHEKIIIIDDWYCIGSSNLNYRSFIHDLEVDVNLRTPEGQSQLEEHFILEKQHSKQVQPQDVKKMSYLTYLTGRVLLLLKYWM